MININTLDYWNKRFGSGDWENKGGFSQTRAFAESQVPLFGINRNFDGTLCDFGCGAGDAFPVYRDAFPKAKLIGIDFSQSAIDLCIKRYGKIAEFITGDANAIPNTDIIVCSNVFEHIEDDHVLLLELLKKCTKKLLVIVPYKERKLITEHLRSYHMCSFDAYSPKRKVVFLSKGWTEYGRAFYVEIFLKNLFRFIIKRELRYRSKQILFEFSGMLNGVSNGRDHSNAQA